MHVYIDESGTFSIPKRIKGPSISCAGALTIPTSRHDQILDDFRKLRVKEMTAASILAEIGPI
jgi:hypothetical protein